MAIPARRRIADVVAFAFATAATVFGLVWLVWILWTTLASGRGCADADPVHAR